MSHQAHIQSIFKEFLKQEIDFVNQNRSKETYLDPSKKKVTEKDLLEFLLGDRENVTVVEVFLNIDFVQRIKEVFWEKAKTVLSASVHNLEDEYAKLMYFSSEQFGWKKAEDFPYEFFEKLSRQVINLLNLEEKNETSLIFSGDAERLVKIFVLYKDYLLEW